MATDPSSLVRASAYINWALSGIIFAMAWLTRLKHDWRIELDVDDRTWAYSITLAFLALFLAICGVGARYLKWYGLWPNLLAQALVLALLFGFRVPAPPHLLPVLVAVILIWGRSAFLLSNRA